MTLTRSEKQRKSGFISPPAVEGLKPSSVLHLALLRLRQQREHRLAPLLLELGQQVGGVVGAHLGQHVRRLGVRALVQELDLVLGIELLEDVGLELAVGADRADDLLALVVRGGLDQVGDLRRVELRQLAEAHPQPRAWAHGRRRARRSPSRAECEPPSGRPAASAEAVAAGRAG